MTVPIVLQDERLTSHEAEACWRGARRTGASASRCSMRWRPQSSCRTISTAQPRPPKPNLESGSVKRRSRQLSRPPARLAVGRRPAAWLLFGLDRPYKGYQAAEQFVEIPRARTGSIGRRLAEAGSFGTPSVSDRARAQRPGRRLQAGEYRFDRPMAPREVVDKIARGDVYLRPITFREGLTIRQMAQLYESKGFAARGVHGRRRTPRWFTTSIRTRAISKAICFPTPTRCRAARPPRSWSRAWWTAIRESADAGARRSSAAARGLSVRELVTLASIVEKETGKPDERPLVAAVYSNRLKIGMGCSAIRRSSTRSSAPAATTATSRATTCRSTRRTTPIGMPACRPDRSPHPAARRSRPPPHPRTCRTSTSSAATTARTRSPPRSTSTTATSSSSRRTVESDPVAEPRNAWLSRTCGPVGLSRTR